MRYLFNIKIPAERLPAEMVFIIVDKLFNAISLFLSSLVDLLFH